MNALAKARVNLREKSEKRSVEGATTTTIVSKEDLIIPLRTTTTHTHGVCPKDAQGIQSLVDLFPCHGIDYGSFLRKRRGTS